jgi:molybdopterin molybdotransferase
MPKPIPESIQVQQPTDRSRDAALLTVEEAQARIMAMLTPVTATESLAIRDSLGRVLATTITSPINVPPYANSAMDGYAVTAADLAHESQTQLVVIGTSWAGTPFHGTVMPGQCVRIMTGAKMPAGTDTVIMQEQVQRQDDRITIGTGHCPGQNVRHPGEDIAQGNTVLQAGQLIGPAELGLLASLGIAQVSTYRRLRVAFFSTGDELRAVGSQLEEGQIYDSNRYTLHGMLSQLGVEIIDMGVIRDDQSAIEAAFLQAAQHADAVITSGGVSVGEADFVKLTLDKLGKVDFWRIAMKPGKPLAVGKINHAMFFGLPGNPVSVMATFYLFALPALRAMTGQSVTPPLRFSARTRQRLRKVPGRMEFQRGLLCNEGGQLLVDATGMQDSHILSGMSRANCFIVLPREAGDIEAGVDVEVIPLRGLIG